MPKASEKRPPSERAKAAARAAKASQPRVQYSATLADKILRRLGAGERWRSIAGLGGMPAYGTLYSWRAAHPEFAKALAQAKQAGADARADAVLDVAEAATAETIPVDRMHIGALKWHVERDDKIWRKDEPDKGMGRTLIVRIRRFERYVAEDGSTQVREILPDGVKEGE